MERDSSTPVKMPRSVWGAVTLVLVALAGLLGRMYPAQEPAAAARNTAVLEDKTVKREPTTDPDEIARRKEYDALRRELTSAVDRVIVLEKRVCVTEQELRDAYARIAQLLGGRHGVVDRNSFERSTVRWPLPENASLKQFQERAGSLREAADSAVAR